MIAIRRAIGVALLCASMPLGAAAQATADAPTAVLQTLGYRLAMLTNPAACFDIAPGSTGARELTRVLAADPGNQEIEADYPGYIAYATTVVIARTQAIQDRLAAETWTALAAIYDAELSPIQLSQANSFFATEAGQRMVLDVCANANLEIIGDAMLASPDYLVSGDAIDRTQRQAAEASAARVASYPARDRAAIQWFGQTDASRATAVLRPRVFATIAEVSNRPDPEFDALIERDIDRFFERAAKGGKPARAP